MSPTRTRLAVAGGGMLVALALAAPAGLANRIHVSSVPCHLAVAAPVHTGGAPGKTVATMSFTCTHGHSRAVATVQSQELMRGSWIHQATRAVTFFQVKAQHRYRTTTPPIDCSAGEYRTIASVKTGGRTMNARSPSVSITCG